MNRLKQIMLTTGFVTFVTISSCRNVRLEKDLPIASTMEAYVNEFNANDIENVVNHIPNAHAVKWIGRNVPLFECPDKYIERT